MVQLCGKVVKIRGEVFIEVLYPDLKTLGWKDGDSIVASILDVERVKK